MTKRRPLDGYFFEDYAVGDVFQHPVPRTITEADASNYIMLVGARYALHCSKPLAVAMGYRACPIDDMLVFNIAFGNTVADVSYNAIANLGYAERMRQIDRVLDNVGFLAESRRDVYRGIGDDQRAGMARNIHYEAMADPA